MTTVHTELENSFHILQSKLQVRQFPAGTASNPLEAHRLRSLNNKSVDEAQQSHIQLEAELMLGLFSPAASRCTE